MTGAITKNIKAWEYLLHYLVRDEARECYVIPASSKKMAEQALTELKRFKEGVPSPLISDKKHAPTRCVKAAKYLWKGIAE